MSLKVLFIQFTRSAYSLQLDDHLGDLDVGLLGGDQVSFVTAFPLDKENDLA